MSGRYRWAIRMGDPARFSGWLGRNPRTLPKHAATGESRPKTLDPAPVDSEVGVTQA